MTDLTHKFTQLEELIASNHTATMDKLDAIIDALNGGVNPPERTIDDLYDVLSQIMIGIQGLGLNQQNTNTQLGLIRNGIALSNQSLSVMATNVNSILQFLATNNWCCEDSPIGTITPPLGTEPNTDEPLRCQKAQYVADIFIALIDGFDALIYQTGPSTIQDVLEVYNNAMLSITVPKPSRDELSRITFALNNARSAGVSNLGGLAFSFKDEVINVIFSAGSALSARQSLVQFWQGHTNDPATWDIMAYSIHNALLNEVYTNAVVDMNPRSYNSALCSVVEAVCRSVSSISVEVTPSNGYSPRNNAVFTGTGAIDTVEYAPGLFVSYNEAVIMTSGFQGGRIYYKSGRVRVVYGNAGLNTHFTSLSTPNAWIEIPAGADYLIIDDFEGPDTPGSGPFQVTLCFGGEEV